MLLQTVTPEGGRADHGSSPPLNPCNGCSVGPEAPSKDCSMLLKHAHPRDHARPGQESCAGHEDFSSTAAGHKQNIEKYISTCITKMTSSIFLLCITTPSHQSTSNSLVWGIRLKNYHTGFLHFLHLPSNAILEPNRMENLCI